MTIGSAVLRGSSIIIYDEKGHQIGSVFGGGTGPNDGLQGYTGSTVSVRRGSSIVIYNEKGHQISSVLA